jgi:hypothetical protein
MRAVALLEQELQRLWEELLAMFPQAASEQG